ncbi:MFS transporter [Aspergillus saccharolyticus JOP 1030-1]|uniref:MFS general substrate transporter n=1 Tax=Aspergillus saccharolyticus JOP 1030-1 TaxID=1450539 RepID=A0A318ZZ99_9EURO|nr:MFS general substrate transporter [Aspergillus saccharolyticus JOP 1030-1]PYH49603.1 MFS general substrate transporter [Aspergillus saccharolyticus JOP 1030-1]
MGLEFVDTSHDKISCDVQLLDGRGVENLVEDIDAQASHHDNNLEANIERTKWKPDVKEWLMIISACLLVTMDALNVTVVIPLIPSLSSTLERALGGILWFETSYLMASATGQALFAMLTDLIGAGPVVLVAVVFATAGTGVCSGSMNLASLIAGRFVQGIGGGAVTAYSLLVMADIIPDMYLAHYSGYLFQARVVGTMLGMVLGGLFSDYTSRIWAFYASFAFCAFGLLIIPFAVDLRGRRSISMRKLRSMGWLSVVLSLLGMSSLLIGLSWGGTFFPWSSWHVLVPLCVGAGVLLLVVVYESLWATRSVFVAADLRCLPRAMMYLSSFLHGFSLLSHLLNLSMYLMLIQHLTPTLSGLSLLTLTAPSFPALLLISKWSFLQRPRTLRWIIRAGWAIGFVASCASITLDMHTPPQAWVFIFLATGISHALLVSGHHRCLQHRPPLYNPSGRWKCDSERTNSAEETQSEVSKAGMLLYSIVRTWGMCIAVPASGAIVLGQVVREMGDQRGVDLLGLGGNGTDRDGSSMMMTLLLLMMGSGGEGEGGGEMEALREMYMDGLQALWRVMMGVMALGGLCSCFAS